MIRSRPSPLLAVPNVTAHPSTGSVPTSYYSTWHYNCLWSLKSWLNGCSSDHVQQYGIVQSQPLYQLENHSVQPSRLATIRPPRDHPTIQPTTRSSNARCNMHSNSQIIIPATHRHGDVIVTSQAPVLPHTSAANNRRGRADGQTDRQTDGRVDRSVGSGHKLNLARRSRTIKDRRTPPPTFPLPSEIGRQDKTSGLLNIPRRRPPCSILNIPCRHDDCSPRGHRRSATLSYSCDLPDTSQPAKNSHNIAGQLPILHAMRVNPLVMHVSGYRPHADIVYLTGFIIFMTHFDIKFFLISVYCLLIYMRLCSILA